jgi:MFS family permease
MTVSTPGSSERSAEAPGLNRGATVAAWLGLERNVVAVSAAMFAMALGEQMWRRFLPKYLETLGAPIVAIGAYGTAEDFLDGIYQYPGGWVADHYGRRRALLLFVGLAAIGYAIIAAAPLWPVVVLGLVFTMAWTSMASPSLFAVIGDALPRNRRAMGFSVQAILRRVPIVVAPTIGGLLIAAWGIRAGVRAGLACSIVLAWVTLAVVCRVQLVLPAGGGGITIRGVWNRLPIPLRRLLVSDIFIRTCEGLVDVFLVIYALNVIGISPPQYGLLVGVQSATAIACYLPVARLADRIARKPFVIATFLAFSAFPIAVIASRSFPALVLAFVVGGLREIGEPARKALILDLAVPEVRARSIGLYYLIRSVAIAPAAFIGGLLWRTAPAVPFVTAGLMGLIGTTLFALTVNERDAG